MVGLPELTAEQARTVLSLLCAMAPGGDQCEAQLRASRQNVLARFDLAGLCADGTAHLTSSGPRWPARARQRTSREAKVVVGIVRKERCRWPHAARPATDSGCLRSRS